MKVVILNSRMSSFLPLLGSRLPASMLSYLRQDWGILPQEIKSLLKNDPAGSDIWSPQEKCQLAATSWQAQLEHTELITVSFLLTCSTWRNSQGLIISHPRKASSMKKRHTTEKRKLKGSRQCREQSYFEEMVIHILRCLIKRRNVVLCQERGSGWESSWKERTKAEMSNSVKHWKRQLRNSTSKREKRGELEVNMRSNI